MKLLKFYSRVRMTFRDKFKITRSERRKEKGTTNQRLIKFNLKLKVRRSL